MDVFVDPFAKPILALLDVAEDALTALVARELTQWERSAAIPSTGETVLAAAIAASMQRTMDEAVRIQDRQWARLSEKSVATFQTQRAAWARDQGVRLAKNLTDDTRERIALILEEAARRGAGPATIRREIAQIIPDLPGLSARARGSLVASTELHNAAMWAQEQEALALSRRGAALAKTWTATGDNRTRPEHRRANGQVRDINQDFTVGGARMSRPGDPRGGVRNVARCRCVCRYIPKDYVLEERTRRAAAMVDFARRRNDFRAEIIQMTSEMDPALAAAVRRDARAHPNWVTPLPATLPPGVTAQAARALQDLIDDRAGADAIYASEAMTSATERLSAIAPTMTLDAMPGADWWRKRRYRRGDTALTGIDAAVEHLSAVARAYAGPEGVAKGKRAVVLLGSPGAGKSRYAEAVAQRMRAAIVDSDDAKAIIPEFAGGVGASAVHAESAVLSEAGVLRAVLREGENVIIPRVGADGASVRTLINALRREGYQVTIGHVRLSAGEAARRQARRFLERGRLIEPGYARSVGERPAKVYRELRGEDGLEWFEIDAEVPFGASPILIGASDRAKRLIAGLFGS